MDTISGPGGGATVDVNSGDTTHPSLTFTQTGTIPAPNQLIPLRVVLIDPAKAAWEMFCQSTFFNTVDDETMGFGYNASQTVGTEPSAAVVIESDYRPGGPLTPQVEFYAAMNTAGGANAYRPWMATQNRASGLTHFGLNMGPVAGSNITLDSINFTPGVMEFTLTSYVVNFAASIGSGISQFQVDPATGNFLFLSSNGHSNLGLGTCTDDTTLNALFLDTGVGEAKTNAAVLGDNAQTHRDFNGPAGGVANLTIANVIELQANDPADGEVGILVRQHVGGGFNLQRVKMGPPDSGGPGFKALIVPNGFLPPQFSGLQLWLRADMGGAANTAPDQSGNGNNFGGGGGCGFNPTGGPQPSQPAWTFDGATQYLTNLVSSIVGQSNYTMFLVSKTTTDASAQVIFSNGTLGANGFMSSIDIGGTGHREMFITGVALADDDPATTNWEAWTVGNSSGDIQLLRVNGAPHTLAPNGNLEIAPDAKSALGASSAGSFKFNGNVWEVIAYSPALTSAQILEVEAYIRETTLIW